MKMTWHISIGCTSYTSSLHYRAFIAHFRSKQVPYNLRLHLVLGYPSQPTLQPPQRFLS